MKIFSLLFLFLTLNSKVVHKSCTVEFLESYNQVKIKIEKERVGLLASNADFLAISESFEDNLINKIIPFWYGTKWAFDGYSNVPNKGDIACGYFVSTTLKHMGLNLNRYKLAQQLPINEAYSLSLSGEVQNINGQSFKEVVDEFYKVLNDGVYFIGVNRNHVGFLYRKSNEIFLIHSNYFSGFVEMERIEESQVMKCFNNFYLTPLSENKELMQRWVRGLEIKVISSYE